MGLLQRKIRLQDHLRELLLTTRSRFLMRAPEQELMLRLHRCRHQQLRSCHSSP
uniref:Uncharacterized protein n=1 Tax=Zea mays TaxID=4577 RepID=C0PLG5_MAIZE|nr:unknown [Zea mays]